jgi:hypothetical protein
MLFSLPEFFKMAMYSTYVQTVYLLFITTPIFIIRFLLTITFQCRSISSWCVC